MGTDEIALSYGRTALDARLASCAPSFVVSNTGCGAACAALRILNATGALADASRAEP